MERTKILKKLKRDEPFDLLVIGGGATGCGVALDAASRGLSVALVEKNDFGEGTSSRSTKLLHGGVRYLEMAVKHLDRSQYHLVRDALRERDILLRIAPHLSRRISLVTPIYKWLKVPYIFAGLKIYDLLAGTKGIGQSRLMGSKNALKRFPMLHAEGLKAGVLYYDGQFNDARMVISIALTAAKYGAIIANHVDVTGFIKKGTTLTGAVVTDSITGESWDITARTVVNATGPFTDIIRTIDEPACRPMLKVSSGIHIVLDKKFAPPDTGLLIPKTEDGRVLFVLPWEGHALVGTTDEPAQVSEHPEPTDDDVSYLIRHLRRYFDIQVSEQDVKSVWSGLRPLIFDPKASDTAKLTRDHVIERSRSGLVTIAGGKWTTYRKMAQDTVTFIVKHSGLTPTNRCCTHRIPLIGAEKYRQDGPDLLTAEFGIDPPVSRHLYRAYGDRADKIAEIASNGFSERLFPDHQYLEAEIVYAAREEMAVRCVDVLSRRTSMALLDRAAAARAIPRVVDLMAEELGWSRDRCHRETVIAEERIKVL